jgi:arylsulfatase A-like enzyme
MPFFSHVFLSFDPPRYVTIVPTGQSPAGGWLLYAGGVVFLSAHAHAVVTLASHCSILTGLYPYQHGVRDNAGFILRGDIPTLGSILKGAGYSTAAFVSAFPLDRRFGLSRGFDVYDDDFSGKSSSIAFAAVFRSGDQDRCA